MTAQTDRALVDANVLVYSALEGAEHHQVCAALLELGRDGGAELCLAPQVLYEYYAVMTNPKLADPVLSVAEALDDIEAFVGAFPLIHPTDDHLERVLDLVAASRLTRQNIFDMALAATMLGNQVSQIYTYNARHFSKIPGISVLQP